MKQYNRKKGTKGEELAVQFLQKKDFRIIETNWQTRFGELDIIASKDSVLHFVEVKLKVGERFGTPEEMINKRKLYQVKKTAEMYLLKNKQIRKDFIKFQIDAIAIVLLESGEVERISYYENIDF